MDVVIFLRASDILHGGAKLASIVLLDCHLDDGEDNEGNVWFADCNSKRGHFGGLGADCFDVGAYLLFEVKGEAEYFDELVQDVGCGWEVCSDDCGGE